MLYNLDELGTKDIFLVLFSKFYSFKFTLMAIIYLELLFVHSVNNDQWVFFLAHEYPVRHLFDDF